MTIRIMGSQQNWSGCDDCAKDDPEAFAKFMRVSEGQTGELTIRDCIMRRFAGNGTRVGAALAKLQVNEMSRPDALQIIREEAERMERENFPEMEQEITTLRASHSQLEAQLAAKDATIQEYRDADPIRIAREFDNLDGIKTLRAEVAAAKLALTGCSQRLQMTLAEMAGNPIPQFDPPAPSGLENIRAIAAVFSTPSGQALLDRLAVLTTAVESAVADFRKLKPFIGDAADATADLYQTYLK